MKSLLTFLIISTACFQIAFARIGETVAECDKRYGACREASLDGSFKEYSVNRLLVTCIFVDAKCVIVTYAIRWSSPVIQAPIGKDRRFSEEQATRLLNLNGNGAAWVQKSKLTFTNGNDGIYETADGKLQALVNFTGVKIETVESYRSRLAGMSDEVIDQALVGIGAKGGGPIKSLVEGSAPSFHVSGVVVEYDSAAARGQRIRSVTMRDGRPLNDRREYRVAMSDFMAGGEDGLALAGSAAGSPWSSMCSNRGYPCCPACRAPRCSGPGVA